MAAAALADEGTLTTVPGIRVGHHTLQERPTGCTVILAPDNTVGGVDVRGGAPGTRETDLLQPENTVQHVNAIVFSGGSAFGLAAADGVMRFLAEKGVGYPITGGPVPIVPAAIIFDLNVGGAPGVRPDFSGRDLTYLDLAGLDFKGATLAKADLYGVDLTSANLSGVDLSEARLDRAVLIRANLSGANLSGATIYRPTIYADLGASLEDAPKFAGATMRGVRVQAELSGADFRGADLTGARMGPHEPRADMSSMPGSLLRGCDFSGATLNGADLMWAKLRFSKFIGADMQGVNLAGADLSMTDFSGADLTGANLEGADLDGTVLRGVRGLDTAKGLDRAKNAERAILR